MDDNYKQHYCRGLSEFKHTIGNLTVACLTAQDAYKEWLKYF